MKIEFKRRKLDFVDKLVMGYGGMSYLIYNAAECVFESEQRLKYEPHLGKRFVYASQFQSSFQTQCYACGAALIAFKVFDYFCVEDKSV